MAKTHLSFHIPTVLLLLCIFRLSNSQSVETRALFEFRKQLNDPLNYLGSWNEAESPCQFVGITCDSKDNVIGISLVNMSLSGKLSPAVSALRSISSLGLQTNAISGAIPPELANCTNLQYLNLSDNSFTSQLPDLSSLQNLQVLDLSKNQLSGKFPAWVGSISGLLQLALAINNFEQGELPPSIGNLKNLTVLYLSQCNLIGPAIPSYVFDMTALSTLDLSKNHFSGKFPKEILNLRNLEKIELFQNNLTGEIFPELAELTSLNEFDISNNHMSGKLPPEIGNINFTVFQIFRNNFWGELPEGFGAMHYLKAFSIYENSFSGEFPANFGRYSPLNGFDISENKFSGPFPRFLCQSNILQYLLALDNNFSGEFPDSYSSCKSLLRFRISQNSFTGKVPDGIWGLPFAVIIDFADNGFIGGISSDIGMSSSLTQLYVQNNKFSGELPAEIGKLYQLQKLFAYNNSFSGQLPSQIGDLDLLTSLHLEMNSLTGPLPSELVKCSSLVDLDLAQNSLNGEIPGEIGLLASLNSLNLSRNMLVGSIPEGLQSLKLSSLDLSKNQLSGRIPPQLLMIAGDEAFSGNPGLCTDRNYGNKLGPDVGICTLHPGHTDFYRRWAALILIIMSIMFMLLAGLAFVSYKKLKIEESCRKVDIEYGGSNLKLESFHPTDIDAEEICDLDEDNLIGSGGTGRVFRLDLNKNRGTFAVKQLWKSEGAKVMMAEIGILGKIRHRNILKLYACVTRGDCSYLVFEYVSNGNLYEALCREAKGGMPLLDWSRRYNIAVGAAKGIMYLHHDCSPTVVHRDIKSSNILLDEEYEAKIADFGIAKVSGVSDNSCFAGTYGYMAPELAYSLMVTEKSDIYSFGVVLLELLTGRSPTRPQFGEGKDIVYWVSTHLDGQKVKNIFDPRISGPSADDMIKVLRIAILCTTKLPNLRPSMREVVNMLIDANPCSPVSRAKSFVKNC